MKRTVIVLLLVAMLGFGGCRKKNIIPDDTLAEIFHDAFVVNAYIGEEHIDLDSLQIYEPIFNSYGYTARDVVHTVGNFSRRKSARLGTVVEHAISRLERESKAYDKGVIILDTIRNVAVRTFSREVYADTLIKARKLADTAALYIKISPVYQGEYEITFKYECEDDLEKYPRTSEFYFESEDGFRNGHTSVSMRKKGSVDRTLVSRSDNSRLVLNIGKFKKRDNNSGSKKRKGYLPKSQNLTIRDLKVLYKPNEDAAIDSLFAKYVDIKIFADGFLIKKDSLALYPDTTRVSTPTPHND